ncbi:MAG: glutamine-hydrolyzing carbamoyl-phosphate synthase small subunit [Chloroflexi bacterium]|nr:glutamine-hydrolyzing carbamoyl-phosphate synthase small subunit [Chloroflexota bacterium]
MSARQGLLALEDGTTLIGRSVAAEGEWTGEIVFVTSMLGYQEIITDPSFWGQMVVFTYPHIGNAGVNPQDNESHQPYVRAVIARQICTQPSNWRASESLPDYLSRHNILALDNIDCRHLTLLLRSKGIMRAAISTTNLDPDRLVEMARNAPQMIDLRPASKVCSPQITAWDEALVAEWRPPALHPGATNPHVVVIDCGAKHSIMRALVSCGARVTVVPYDTSAEAILQLAPDGVLVSNGPGDPTTWEPTVNSIRALLGKLPLFGICLGHHLIALACGRSTERLLFGHHGDNQPVQRYEGGMVEITAQNHHYVVASDAPAGSPLVNTTRNLNDGTVESGASEALRITSVQYHPEASPGPHDSAYLLAEFVSSLVPNQQAEA